MSVSNLSNYQKSVMHNHGEATYTRREFPGIELNKCVNKLSYGVPVKKLTKRGKGSWHYVTFFIHEDDATKLQWVSSTKEYSRSRIDLLRITTIGEYPTFAMTNELQKYSKQLLCIYHGGGNELLLLFDNQVEKLEWWCGLQYFITRAHESQKNRVMSSVKQVAQDAFNKADKDGDKTLTKEEARIMLREMQIGVQKKQLDQIFQAFDADKNGVMDKTEFETFMKTLMIKKEILPIFKLYAQAFDENKKEEPCMSPEELVKFYKKEQKIELSMSEAKEIVHALRLDSLGPYNSPEDDLLSFYDFSNLIFSPQNSIFNSSKKPIYQDMTRPLTDYYINSSHNTYLEGNQISSLSSIRAYIRALDLGCRSVEIDLWNGENAEPVVTHGHTLTSKILFKDLVIALKEHAFQKTQYPLILSFEMHCDLRGQERVLTIIEAEIKEQVYVIPADYTNFEYYPGPQDLMGKFIIKSKGRKLTSHGFVVEQVEPGQDDEHLMVDTVQKLDDVAPYNVVEDDSDEVKNQIMRKYGTGIFEYEKSSDETLGPKLVKYRLANEEEKTIDCWRNNQEEQVKDSPSYLTHQHDKFRQNQYILNDNTASQNYLGLEHHPASVNKELSISSPAVAKAGDDAVVLNNTIGTKETLEDAPPNKKTKTLNRLAVYYSMLGTRMAFEPPRTIWEISSINESKISSLYKAGPKRIIDFNKKHLTRIYPSGKRLHSSNYDPIKAWIAGSQMVALNLQTSDEATLLNYAKFNKNGHSGFVLKPKYILSNTLHQPERALYPHQMVDPKRNITITVISGQHFCSDIVSSKDIVDLYVDIKLRGTDIDEMQNTSLRTPVIKDNGFNPYWSEDKPCLHHFKVSAPEFATLVFKVFNQNLTKNTRVAWYAIEIGDLQPGYRCVPMLDSNFEEIRHCYLLVHIKFTEYK